MYIIRLDEELFSRLETLLEEAARRNRAYGDLLQSLWSATEREPEEDSAVNGELKSLWEAVLELEERIKSLEDASPPSNTKWWVGTSPTSTMT